MTDVKVQGGRYIIALAKLTLALTREEFIEALRRRKPYKRCEAPQARLANRASYEEG